MGVHFRGLPLSQGTWGHIAREISEQAVTKMQSRESAMRKRALVVRREREQADCDPDAVEENPLSLAMAREGVMTSPWVGM